MIYWNFVVDKKEKPSVNVKRLLGALAFKELEFITNERFENRNLSTEKFAIESVTMVGTVLYVKQNLHGSIESLKDFLDGYIASEESVEEKIFELSLCRIRIKEFFLNNNEDDLVLLNMNSSISINSFHYNEPIEARLEQCSISDNAWREIKEHQYIRQVYINLLDSHLALWIDKVQLSPLLRKRLDAEVDSGKEMKLLEVWIGLKEAGFINHISGNLDFAEHRRAFFELFNLSDRKFNERNREIKKRKKPVAIFLTYMADSMDEYHKEKTDMI